MEEYGRYRINLNDDWSLEDLYRFPRAYEQVYFFFVSLDRTLEAADRDRLVNAYRTYPWQGGYSAVSFFNQLKFSVKPKRRPQIIAMQKASPGWMDLGLWIATATSVAAAVKTIAGAIDAANSTYSNIYKGMQDRKLLKLKVSSEKIDLDKKQLDFVEQSSNQMAKLLGFKSPREIDALTGSPYLTLKILLSVYRRVRTLAEFENKGKAHLTNASGPKRKNPRP
ncbi:hypothetical protein [Methylocystis sp. S23]